MRTIYIPMNAHNVFRECNEDEQHLPRNTNPRVYEFLRPLFNELSKKQPTWRYVTKSYGDLDPTSSFYLFKRFTIMDGDDELGEVWASKNWRTGENRYAFNNHRLQAARNRGSCNETKDLKKAVKFILSNMYAHTLPELMHNERRSAGGKVRSAIYALQREHRNTRDRLMPDIMAFVASRYDDFICTGSSTLRDKEQLLDTYERSCQADKAERAMSSDGILVVERGNQFHVELASNEGTFHSFVLEEMPAKLREAIALLKLYEPEKLLDGVGMRTGSKTFYIIKGDN
jgi:hypothetical protein